METFYTVDVNFGVVIEAQIRYVQHPDGGLACETRKVERDRFGNVMRTTEWEDLGTRIRWG
jgi:hypothetical protein